MNVDIRAIAEEQNWFVAHHWFDGFELPLFGVPLGPIVTYNVLQVMGNQWLGHWEDEAGRAAELQRAAEAQRAAQESVQAAAGAGSEGNTGPNTAQAASEPATAAPDGAPAVLEVSDGA